MDKTGQNIASKLSELEQRNSVYLQWISSHDEVYGIEMTVELAKKGCDIPAPNSIDLWP